VHLILANPPGVSYESAPRGFRETRSTRKHSLAESLRSAVPYSTESHDKSRSASAPGLSKIAQTAFAEMVKTYVSQRGRPSVFPSFDVFKLESSGQVLWKGFEESFRAAKATTQKLMVASPGDYLIVDQCTGQKVVVTR
jgi:hypothetical protein